ncbi:hypothetical protein PybrP1_003929 [[Pythium] brassicae (nom. inval.)]|nr:hypothetical protein PybrP1_003929 [[Pythium] brassicae (nom. inval.)]
MMRDVGARFKYTDGNAPAQAPPLAAAVVVTARSPRADNDEAEEAEEQAAGDAPTHPPLAPTSVTTVTAAALAAAPPATPDCPSRELIQQRLRSYHRDLETGAATWRSVGERMQRDLAPYAVLKLGGFSLGDVAPKLLGHVLAAGGSRLRTLDLGFNRIGDRGAALLAQALETNATLERLYLSGNDIGPAGALALARALAANSALRSLHLSGNNVGEDGAAHLADGLRANRGLRALYVGTNGIGSRGMARLADALTVNRTLAELTLGQNRIGSAGLRHVADALASGRTVLTTLEMGKNGIDQHGALALARALCSGGANALQNLYLDNNPLGDVGAGAFGALLAKHAGLRVLDLSYSQMSLLGLRDLSMGLAHSSSLLCLLLDGHDWASTQFMGKTNGLTGASLAAKGANSYAASCIVGAINANARSGLLKLTGVDLSLVVPAAPASATTIGASATTASADDSGGDGTRRYSDALSRNERVLQFLRENRRPAASNKRKIADDDGRQSPSPHADEATAATGAESVVHPKYQRLDALGPVKSSSSSGSIGSTSESLPLPSLSPPPGPVASSPRPSGGPPMYTARRPPRVGMPPPAPTPAAESTRLALKSPRYESTMESQVRRVMAEIATLPFSADEYANLQVYYLGRCTGGARDTAANPDTVADDEEEEDAVRAGGSCSDGGDAAPAERSRCPACRTSRLAKFRRVMALKARLEARHEATESTLLVILRQLHYLVGVFQHVENAERRIDELLVAAHDPSLLALPPSPSPSSGAFAQQTGE